MGADCGCGGTCPVCSRVVGFLIPAHRAAIHEAAEREGLTEESPDSKKEGQKDKPEA